MQMCYFLWNLLESGLYILARRPLLSSDQLRSHCPSAMQSLLGDCETSWQPRVPGALIVDLSSEGSGASEYTGHAMSCAESARSSERELWG
jgi:hypothetical protein